MRVFEIMSEPVHIVKQNLSVADARALMRQNSIHHLLVADDEGPVGVISARDAAGAAQPRRLSVSEVMSTPILTIDSETPRSQAPNIMRGRSIGSLIVKKGGRVVGIVTVSDLLDLIGRGAARQPKREARPELHHRVPHTKRHRARSSW